MIVIYGIKEHLNPVKAELSDVIHGCMQSVLGLPEDKRAHRFIPLAAENFYYPADRTSSYTAIEINMMQGRSPETQKALIKELFDLRGGRPSIPQNRGYPQIGLYRECSPQVVV